jgi:hypothetical protein
MRFPADENFALRPGHLRMTAQTQIGIALNQQLGVDRPVRRVAGGTALPQRVVPINHHAGLLAMAVGARRILTCRQSQVCRSIRFKPVRIVAIGAAHVPFRHRVMNRQSKLKLRFRMATVAGRRVFARINDELTPTAAHSHVFAARTMTGLAPGLAGHFGALDLEPAMSTEAQTPHVIAVAGVTLRAADKHCPLDLRWRRNDSPLHRAAGHHTQPGDSHPG